MQIANTPQPGRTRVKSTEILSKVGSVVEIRGWLHRQRELASVTFLVLRDGNGLAQVVLEDAALRMQAKSLLPETVLAVSGMAVASAQAPMGVEINAARLDVLESPEGLAPIELHRPVLKEQLPTRLNHASISLRHPTQRAIFRIGAATMGAFRRILSDRDFVEIQTPKLVEAATEGGANVFAVDYFGRNAYLAQSPQFYKQIMVGVFERVFEVGPVFRAEPHDTVRHLNEYVSLDAEMAFIESHHDVMAVLRDVVAAMAADVAAQCRDELAVLKIDMPAVPEEIPWIDFGDAQTLIESRTGESRLGEPDLTPSDERELGGWALEEHGSEFLFVTGFPLAKRPFYTHPDPDSPTASNSFDLLFRGLELVTGGQRLHRIDDYRGALASRGIGEESLEWYLEAFRYGMPPHGGFAIGLERWLARVSGASNIRETTLFPRDMSRLRP